MELLEFARDDQSKASRYTFHERERGSLLMIEGGADRTPVSVVHEGPRFRVMYDGPRFHESTATGLFDYYKLSRRVAQGLMSRWQGDPSRRRVRVVSHLPAAPRTPEVVVPVPKAVREWAETQTARANRGKASRVV
jgi:hypothetical protein